MLMGHSSNSSFNSGKTPGSELQSPSAWDSPAFIVVNNSFSTDFAALILSSDCGKKSPGLIFISLGSQGTGLYLFSQR